MYTVKEMKQADNEKLLDMYETVLTEAVKWQGFNTTLNKKSDRIKKELLERLKQRSV